MSKNKNSINTGIYNKTMDKKNTIIYKNWTHNSVKQSNVMNRDIYMKATAKNIVKLKEGILIELEAKQFC